MRLGLVELFLYDSEEFWFRDGRLLLRGNNGTGKSKVLSLTLPLVFDAQLKSSRVEPDGDPTKKMAWNLLMGQHERRMGYAWVEFGRMDEDGQPHYLTLGCGLSAAAARPQVDSWFFTLDELRIGQDFWLTSKARVVLTRDRLREALQGHGQVFQTAEPYRRAVDERLFQLGPTRYAALMDTLIQLRQPQLSKKPDESRLSNALTEALTPVPTDLLADVADALNQMEEYRRELEEYESLEKAISQFNVRYQQYAATQTRRQAGSVRSAQTGFDNASQALNAARSAQQITGTENINAQDSLRHAELRSNASRTRQLELLRDPAMADAKTLAQAEKEAHQHQKDADTARQNMQARQKLLQQEQKATQSRAGRVEAARLRFVNVGVEISNSAEQAGLSAAYLGNPLGHDDSHTLAPPELDSARRALRDGIANRRLQVDGLLHVHDKVDNAAKSRLHTQSLRDERADETDSARARREKADAAALRESDILVDAWHTYFDNLQQLHVSNQASIIESLSDWASSLEGKDPARAALHEAQQTTSVRLAKRQTTLETQRQTLAEESAALKEEQAGLEDGHDAVPPLAYWRGTATREGLDGAPLWQLVDFQTNVGQADRAGIEAALQAAGLLDAWVMPDGRLADKEGASIFHDAQWLTRPRHPHSLAHWLCPASPSELTPSPIEPSVVQSLLEGILASAEDDPAAEAWLAPDGNFRLGALRGAWQKPEAEFIGYPARAASRARRLDEIANRQRAITNDLSFLRASFDTLSIDQQRASDEWHSAPSDDVLRAAHVHAVASVRELAAAEIRLQDSEQQLRIAVQAYDSANQQLEQDAKDMHLPIARDALDIVRRALQTFAEAVSTLYSAARELRDAVAEHEEQIHREERANTEATEAADAFADREVLVQDALIRLETLRESLGARVEELQQRLTQAQHDVDASEEAHKSQTETARDAGAKHAVAVSKAETAETSLSERTEARRKAVAAWQAFAATGLLSSGLPEIELPSLQHPWTIEPALALARRAEQALLAVKDDEVAWARVQRLISEDFTELGRTLTALGHQAQTEASDFGMVVSVTYQNRPERPDQLSARLTEEIDQRREILTARERQVLENHLEAEIASAIQKLLRDAERQVEAINLELEKRPTSTGVRFRLEWQLLPEGLDGSPVGLKAARRLLNTSTDLWTAEDRRAVGDMLQQRIADERQRADAELGGTLLEHLTRALDYRRWHRFRVARWDGQWRPLSGPASSGERALGLTVPLFAAVSSYYTQSGYAHAPRLVLLDEVFAGIDDAARKHCWALTREFDLDFVVTSEREWACSSELPGVGIAQLQRREGIDAVHVSRWTWDGRSRQRENDPDRRFHPE